MMRCLSRWSFVRFSPFWSFLLTSDISSFLFWKRTSLEFTCRCKHKTWWSSCTVHTVLCTSKKSLCLVYSLDETVLLEPMSCLRAVSLFCRHKNIIIRVFINVWFAVLKGGQSNGDISLFFPRYPDISLTIVHIFQGDSSSSLCCGAGQVWTEFRKPLSNHSINTILPFIFSYIYISLWR